MRLRRLALLRSGLRLRRVVRRLRGGGLRGLRRLGGLRDLRRVRGVRRSGLRHLGGLEVLEDRRSSAGRFKVDDGFLRGGQRGVGGHPLVLFLERLGDGADELVGVHRFAVVLFGAAQVGVGDGQRAFGFRLFDLTLGLAHLLLGQRDLADARFAGALRNDDDDRAQVAGEFEALLLRTERGRFRVRNVDDDRVGAVLRATVGAVDELAAVFFHNLIDFRVQLDLTVRLLDAVRVEGADRNEAAVAVVELPSLDAGVSEGFAKSGGAEAGVTQAALHFVRFRALRVFVHRDVAGEGRDADGVQLIVVQEAVFAVGVQLLDVRVDDPFLAEKFLRQERVRHRERAAHRAVTGVFLVFARHLLEFLREGLARRVVFERLRLATSQAVERFLEFEVVADRVTADEHRVLDALRRLVMEVFRRVDLRRERVEVAARVELEDERFHFIRFAEFVGEFLRAVRRFLVGELRRHREPVAVRVFQEVIFLRIGFDFGGFSHLRERKLPETDLRAAADYCKEQNIF